ncbi:MAG: MarR family transcriptional regulator [bacterium]|nr:MarR family transcriptional regulator [Clostridium sp.]MCM1537680.1 MarR family transcriptional regulator [bacterium]
MEIRECLNELFVQLFRDILIIEEKALKKGEHQNLTINDMHVIDAIGDGAPKNMSSVAKALQVTTGTLTISVNSLVKKGYVDRVRSEEDRRVVLVSLTEAGRRAHSEHKRFHERMIERITERLSPAQSEVLAGALTDMVQFFKEQK